ncbi:phosphatidylserine decarboxylase [Lasiosphaeria ovina]|uniref:Phosphatidylserine decarboxylase n=1 Tax=Lasiosphaeria ovina TaxID=92902 RepID=A0AAE0MY20_9PEZI|nr:phosphatidylserine decarboxylase [Lasiosphaeria ovina]
MSSNPLVKHRLGGWLAADRAMPTVVALAAFIETTLAVRMLFNLALEQVPDVPPYNQDPTGKSGIRTVAELMLVFDTVQGQSPDFIAFPLNAALEWPMATNVGISLFLRSDVNQYLRDMLNAYGEFLTTSLSASVLNTSSSGWLNEIALGAIVKFAEPKPTNKLTFADIFACDPTKPAYGYGSYDAFMTRSFVDGVRPVGSPDDPNVIVNCCELTPLNNLSGSLVDIMGGSLEDAAPFAGGALYQAFLPSLSYHCWHAPTGGTVKKITHIEGPYYAENSLYLQVATRSVMLVESDNPAIGVMAVVPVGMAEVSGCDWKVKEGDRVTEGQLIGMFHFGGSTHLLLFRKGVESPILVQR